MQSKTGGKSAGRVQSVALKLIVDREREIEAFIPEEYFMALGASKNGNIQYDDSVGFLDDTRTWKIKTYANGRAFDNTVALVLDISKLEALYVTVLNKSDVPTV